MPGRVEEDEQDRRDDEDSHRVPEPPEEPRGAVGTLQVVRKLEHGRAVGRADRGARNRASDDERKNRPNPVERRREADPTHEERARDRRQRVPDGDARRDGQSRPGRGIGGEGADRHRGPVADAQNQQRGEGDARRRPHGRDHAAGHREAHAELRRPVVGDRDQREPENEPDAPMRVLQRPIVESAVHRPSRRSPPTHCHKQPRGVSARPLGVRRRLRAWAVARSRAGRARSRPREARSPRALRASRRRTRRGRSGRGPRG